MPRGLTARRALHYARVPCATKLAMDTPYTDSQPDAESIRDYVRRLVAFSLRGADDASASETTLVCDALEWIADVTRDNASAIADAFAADDVAELTRELQLTGAPCSRTLLRAALVEAFAPRAPSPASPVTPCPCDETVRAALTVLRENQTLASFGSAFRVIHSMFPRDDDLFAGRNIGEIRLRLARALAEAHPKLVVADEETYANVEATLQPVFEDFCLHERCDDASRVVLALALHATAYPRCTIAAAIVGALREANLDALDTSAVHEIVLRRLGPERPASIAQLSLLRKYFRHSRVRHLTMAAASRLIDGLKPKSEREGRRNL